MTNCNLLFGCRRSWTISFDSPLTLILILTLNHLLTLILLLILSRSLRTAQDFPFPTCFRLAFRLSTHFGLKNLILKFWFLRIFEFRPLFEVFHSQLHRTSSSLKILQKLNLPIVSIDLKALNLHSNFERSTSLDQTLLSLRTVLVESS